MEYDPNNELILQVENFSEIQPELEMKNYVLDFQNVYKVINKQQFNIGRL